jgi:adenylate kinase family enzyme
MLGRPADTMLYDRRRIIVIGSGGAGKSTFAAELAKYTGLPLIHLDRYYWKPGWVPTPNEKWIECVQQLSSGDSWIMDGNYSGSLSIRVQRCDGIIFFDMPRLICVRGILQRRLAYRLSQRPDLPEGCSEQVTMEFLRWVWNYPRKSRPRIIAALGQANPETEILIVTRRAQAREILDAVSKRAAQHAAGAGR